MQGHFFLSTAVLSQTVSHHAEKNVGSVTSFMHWEQFQSHFKVAPSRIIGLNRNLIMIGSSNR